MTKKIGVIGAGAWGTALAQSCALNGSEVVIWAREPEVVKTINEKHENSKFLPAVELDKKITATESLTVASDCDILLLVTPAQYTRTIIGSLKPDIAEGNLPLVICSKGIEIESGKLLSEVVREEVPYADVSVLTGPTFASDIARGLPSAATIAADDMDKARMLQSDLSSKTLRLYATDDIMGAQIGGAIKNVIAIACGIIEGMHLGDSARAALITRGLAEMTRMSSVVGANKETLMGMCGIGDLMLTCSSMQSRNFSLGVLLGQGKSLKDILSMRNSVTEGVHTAKALKIMAEKHAIEMPISSAVYKCLCENISSEDAIEEILDRPLKRENS